MLRKVLPPAYKQFYRLLQVRRRYPGAGLIETPWVGDGAQLGAGVQLGAHVFVNSGVVLGDYSYANIGAVLSSGVIGRFCSIGPYAEVGPPQHPLDHLSSSPALYVTKGGVRGWDAFPSPPRIGSDVWVGSRATIMQGVRVGHGAVIGAGSVVTTDVEPYAVAVGVPSRTVRKRFDDATVDTLLASEWWSLSLAEIHGRLGSLLMPRNEWPSNWSQMLADVSSI